MVMSNTLSPSPQKVQDALKALHIGDVHIVNHIGDVVD